MYKTIKLLMLAIFAFALTLSSFAVTAKSDGTKGNSSKETKSQSQQNDNSNDNDDFSLNINFSLNDQKIINDYFHNNNYKFSTLPPGIAKNLARGKPLPPGIAKKSIPSGLASSLNINPNYDYLMVGNSIALVAKSTGIVSDLFDIK